MAGVESRDPTRPDPDALLALAGGQRGRLLVFIGAAPGVGKTYAMLERAQRLFFVFDELMGDAGPPDVVSYRLMRYALEPCDIAVSTPQRRWALVQSMQRAGVEPPL